ncbi:MAG TPA: hypothetical protein VL361_04525 [Candidatus Limnocylindrales bacterium]|nr:hypothetical protein [Candidatus Limnocylindrales bacterium]
MKPRLAPLLSVTLSIASGITAEPEAPDRFEASSSLPSARAPIGLPGQVARYRLQASGQPRASTVIRYELGLGAIEQRFGHDCQWLWLQATKADGKQFRIWLLAAAYPAEEPEATEVPIARYILQEGTAQPLEFQERFTRRAVLPQMIGWHDLLPWPWTEGNELDRRTDFPQQTQYLGLTYTLEKMEKTVPVNPPEDARIVELQPDLLIGTASNMRQKDERRRYDNSDYELVRFTRADYVEMTEAGINCLKVDAEQLPWVENLNAFYWGLNVTDLPYPECLYRSSYLGPVIFLDEPAVGTRDAVIRPRLAKDAEFRRNITPGAVFEAFEKYFHHELREGSATVLPNQLRGRSDVDLGDLAVTQQNLFSWETMVSTAAYELSQAKSVPAAMVFEPPGRVGTLRTLPELDMTYGCQLAIDNPYNLTAIIYGFLRGGARLTNKSWGTSIYGAVDRADAFWFLTHAYDLGATRFFFWDNAKLACVPYGECLALARNLRAHAENHPGRELRQLRRAGEVAILLPPGYNLGHVHLGKGSLWGVPELNLERVNQRGVKYRTVMSNFFIEIERCLRLGVAFDLLWDLPQKPSKELRLLASPYREGYREVVRIREDGKVEVTSHGTVTTLKQARIPTRPAGRPPALSVELSQTHGRSPLVITARASVTEQTSPVYYTYGADPKGVYHNAWVGWELFGPGEEDYRVLMPQDLNPKIVTEGNNAIVSVSFLLDRPGNYRLRAATVDFAGRSTVVWRAITMAK